MWSFITRATRTVITATAFFFFFLGGCILSWIVMPVVGLCVRERKARARRSQAIMVGAFRLFHGYMTITRVLRFARRDVALVLPPGPSVVIANHPTLVDVTALVALIGPACIVAKRSMFRSPLVGRLLRFGWHIEAATDPIADGARVLQEAADRLAAGLPVLVFPEGTRSPVGGLHPFKRGAFEIAVRANVPVVCFEVRCEPPMLSRAHPWYTTPRTSPRLTVTQLPTLSPAAWSGNSLAGQPGFARPPGVTAKAMARDVEILYTGRVTAQLADETTRPEP